MKIQGGFVIIGRGDNLTDVEIRGAKVMLDTEAITLNESDFINRMHLMGVIVSGTSILGCSLTTNGSDAKERTEFLISMLQQPKPRFAFLGELRRKASFLLGFAP